MTGRIFNIQRCCIHDGPGIRTTVFFKGCPLRCAWCHNPEGIDPRPVLSFTAERCIGCGFCFRTCPHGAHVMVDGAHHLQRDKCEVCGSCTQECYAGGLELVGKETTVAEVMRQVASDLPFYETSGGGMTLSGGEPLMQLEFAEALLLAARAAGIHCCVETCGHVPHQSIQRISGLVDLFLYDVKDTDPRRHRANTGVGTERILSNLRWLHDQGSRIVLRIPLIPGHNDQEDNLLSLKALVDSLPRLAGVEIMPYHRLGESKTQRLGLPAAPAIQPPAEETVRRWRAVLRR